MQAPRLSEEFKRRFGRKPDVVTRAPGRVNLIGEHVDYNDGLVLPIALQQSTWLAAAQRRDDAVRIYSENLHQEQNWRLGGWSADGTNHWTSYVAGVAELLRERGAHLDGFDLLIDSEVPVGSGLSSSAALEVATALALAYVCGEPLAGDELAELCRQAEHRFAGVPCGIMDQYASLKAKADHALLLDCRSRDIEHIPAVLPGFGFLVADSGQRHELASGDYADRLADCRRAVEYFQQRQPQVRALRDVSPEMLRSHASQMDPLAAARTMHVISEIQRVQDAAAALRRGDAREFGKLLSASHRSLRDDYEVSCRALDKLVELLSSVRGVQGARMIGGGFGGCVLAVVADESLSAAKDMLRREYKTPQGGEPALWDVHPGAGAEIVSS